MSGVVELFAGVVIVGVGLALWAETLYSRAVQASIGEPYPRPRQITRHVVITDGDEMAKEVDRLARKHGRRVVAAISIGKDDVGSHILVVLQ